MEAIGGWRSGDRLEFCSSNLESVPRSLTTSPPGAPDRARVDAEIMQQLECWQGRDPGLALILAGLVEAPSGEQAPPAHWPSSPCNDSSRAPQPSLVTPRTLCRDDLSQRMDDDSTCFLAHAAWFIGLNWDSPHNRRRIAHRNTVALFSRHSSRLVSLKNRGNDISVAWARNSGQGFLSKIPAGVT